MSDTAHSPATDGSKSALTKLAVGAIGVVFGDIGTSPLYAMKETFVGHHPLTVDLVHVFGVVSADLLVDGDPGNRIKYVVPDPARRQQGRRRQPGVARADPAQDRGQRSAGRSGLVLLGVFATALFYGDSMITPAISVLSAVEGLTVVQDSFTPFVLPIAAGILIALFVIQKRGTDRVGKLFGPLMLIYFLTLAVLGTLSIVAAAHCPAGVESGSAIVRFFAVDPWLRVPRARLGRCSR